MIGMVKMSFFQTFYDENGNAIFDPMAYGDNIRVDTAGNGLKFYDSTGTIAQATFGGTVEQKARYSVQGSKLL